MATGFSTKGKCSVEYQVRQESAGILGNQAVVLAHTDPRGLIADHPGTDQRVAIAKLWQRRELLKDKRRIRVGPILFHDQTIRCLQLDVGAFPREEWLAHPTLGHRFVRVGIQVGGEQVRMTFVEFPQQRQDAFVGDDGFPGRFEKLRIALGNRCTKGLVEDELPGVQFEQVRNPAIFKVDEASVTCLLYTSPSPRD